MEKFTAVRDNQMDLEFTGEKLGSVTDTDQDSSTTHTLYRTAGGRYVYERKQESRDGYREASNADVYHELADLLARAKQTSMLTTTLKQLFKEAGLPTTVPVDPPDMPKPHYELESYVGPDSDGGSWNFTLPGVDGLYSTFSGTRLARAVNRADDTRVALFAGKDGRYVISRGLGDGGINTTAVYDNRRIFVDNWSAFDDLTKALLAAGEVVDPRNIQ